MRIHRLCCSEMETAERLRFVLDGLFFPAFITQPHHAAHLAGRGHHFCRLHRLTAALGHVEINHCLLGGCFGGLAHFCHGTSPPYRIRTNLCILTISGEMSRKYFRNTCRGTLASRAGRGVSRSDLVTAGKKVFIIVTLEQVKY